MNNLFNSQTRLWLYRVVIALFPALTALGYALPGGSEVWTNLVATILGIGTGALAASNINKPAEDRQTVITDTRNEV